MTLEELAKQNGFDFKCPVCGSRNLEIRTTFFAKWYVCLDCGHNSNPVEDQEDENQ